MNMRLFTSARRGLLGVISCLALLLGMVSFTGTASAHTASPAQAASFRPRISVFNVFDTRRCVVVGISGRRFVGDADLFATDEEGFHVFLKQVGVNENGRFFTFVRVCGFFQREDIFSRDNGCFQDLQSDPGLGLSCFREDSSLQNSNCFDLGDPELTGNCFREHRFFFFFQGPIFIFARDDETGRRSNTIAVDVNESFF